MAVLNIEIEGSDISSNTQTVSHFLAFEILIDSGHYWQHNTVSYIWTLLYLTQTMSKIHCSLLIIILTSIHPFSEFLYLFLKINKTFSQNTRNSLKMFSPINCVGFAATFYLKGKAETYESQFLAEYYGNCRSHQCLI